MAPKTDQLLVVVSILEGRHFPKSPRFSLVVQASFDGEQLATDPVEHSEQPPFGTELAWELDRRTLHQHRLQRTPIKLQCFAVDSVSGRKESVGYIVLDLRSVQEVKQEPRWFPLLSSKYTKLKPALLLAAALENDTKFSEPSPDRFKARKAPPRQGSPAVTELLPDRLQAELVQDQGYHQVGPADHCTDMFVLSVTVAFATKLEQLIPSTMKLSAEGSDFFFYYSLLGNDITSEPFHNLLSPDFEPERASVRLRSSSQVLQAFLSRQPSLQIHLCCGNHSLGGTDVSLSALAAVSVDLENRAATVEGAFVLRPPTRVKHTLPALPADLQPTVGVAVTLRREDAAAQVESSECNKEGSGARTRSVPTSVPLPLPPAAAPSVPPPAEPRPRSSSPLQKPPDSSPPPPLPPPSFHTESEAESLLEELQRPTGEAQKHSADVEVPDARVEAGASSVSVSAPKVSIPSSAHHYSFSLDLCSLGSLGLTHPVAATLRYSYPFFGSAAPIMTSPPVELQRNVEASVPQSYCAFDFAALPQQLQDTFRRVPLLVEVWHRDPSSRDQLIGRASVQLSRLLSAERSRLATSSTGETSWRQTHRDRIAVVGKVAELSYVATLEDLGLVKAREVVVSDSSQNELEAPTRSPAPPGPVGPAAPRDTLEYRTALELELWKEEQEDLFDDQLRKKELSHMRALAEEWRKRDREREALNKKKEVEFNLLEEQLQKTLADLEKREKQLTEAELQTQRLQRDLRAEHDLAQRELQESSRRLQLDCDHRAALERDKVRVMEEERARLLQQVGDARDCRYKQLEREFQSYREQQNVRPEFRLQSEVNLLTLEKVELERKLDSTTKSKLHYKQQWGRALKELARFKQREQENAMTRLKKQQAELEVLRRHHLATEEKEAVQQDRRELDDIRNDLNRKKQTSENFVLLKRFHPGLNDSADEHLSRLLEERDTLLRTGVYTHEDRIIAELTRRIQDAMRNRPIRRDLAPDAR
uniref:Centrosomal protein 120 n=1 Tax=Scophthalmus maximus TaxID=52904 RepID=A0A8D3AP07_SCOMX